MKQEEPVRDSLGKLMAIAFLEERARLDLEHAKKLRQGFKEK